MDERMTTIQASVIDGIALTPRFRERNLTALHSALQDVRAELVEEIKQQGATNEEAMFQYLLTLNALKEFHSTVHPQACQEAEYRVARSQDHPDQRRPYGYAYIVPAHVDELYSTVVAVAAALAAGNCILVQRRSESTRLLQILEKLLTGALSPEVFVFASKDPFDTIFQQRHRSVLQGAPASDLKGGSPPVDGQVAVVVNRTADLRAAARDCVHARFAFGGTSAYAPDVVLVNDFCVDEFASAVAEAALSYLTGPAHHNNSDPRPQKQVQEPPTDLKEILKTSGTILAAGHGGQVVLLRQRNSKLLSHKVDSPVLVILPITSVDDAIDWLNSSPSPLAATYIYSTPAFAKYVSQFARSYLSLVNHIPPELLVGPRAPSAITTSVHPRYTPEMFSVVSPTLIEHPPHLQGLDRAIWSDAAGGNRKKLQDLLETRLTPVKEPFGPAVGFFEQGFLVGASLVLSSTIACGVLSIKYGYPALMARLAR
ncbi:uncharacterized protein HMPREF1541_01470 [Cyphellophora europaea CBS 101466]|uniref:Aldehyde dehydrogenase domain-containing protein n=1 Tax=Cyphellophora europaea (strain CBS 101466) TaxID=1220924 RepID=W2S0S0_CYPE1|nr:uncharacterized protein HMPREF1541_01470 [Cyphellophora europaea CBS 101466]ETN42316.1 hypothetical protein HMPREF1541_01470 [Cyphellophora europaea CBS 101466]